MLFSMTSRLQKPKAILPSDKQHHLGGTLFLVSLLVFFLSSILLYGIYAYSRRGDPESAAPLPSMFLISTACLLLISVLVHAATRAIRRERRLTTSVLLLVSGITAVVFMGLQFDAMSNMLAGPALDGGTGKGVVGMVVVLALLHAAHVAGGVVALTVVSIRSWLGRYDHERHWPVDFAAQYWHFLDIVWLCMLLAFCLTTGGFIL
jgi:cytochrome c oxidase subunit 3